MGSIAAILARSIPVDTGAARRMLAAAPHRGSDFIVRICGRCVLGVSNQHDFIDSTVSRDGDFMAVFSGKLDNALELAKMLATTGHEPASTGAADITVSAFKVFGPDAPNYMRGIFAGLATDGTQMWCFRDHVGFQPLFYRDDPRAFFAATEPKQVIAGAALRREPDLEVLERIFYGKTPADMPSAFKGVDRLPQATTLLADSMRAGKPHRYWKPADILETAGCTPAEASERFLELFTQAVGRNLTGNDDIIMLSGGIDSSAVAAFAAPRHFEMTGRSISALSAVFPELQKVDETSYVRLIAEYLNIELHTYEIKAGMLDDLQRWCDLLDGPVPSLAVPQINEYYGLVRKLGLRNILTGEMAEFLFTFHSHIFGHLLTHGRWKAIVSLASAERRRGVSWKSITRQLLAPLVPGRLTKSYLHLRGLDHPERIPDWMDSHKVNQKAPYRTDLLKPATQRWSAWQLLSFDSCTITIEAVESCASLNGVRVRHTFADVDLWEFLLSLRAEVRFPDLGSKTLVRKWLRGRLPDQVLDRKDKTFFNDHLMRQVNYPVLRQFLINPNHVIDGVDYKRLAARLEREDLNLIDFLWVKDLVRIHAFLSLW